MKSSRSRRVILGAVSLVAVAAITIPELGQERPESILPPGFGDPALAPAPTPAATPGRPAAAPTAPARPPVDLLPDLGSGLPADLPTELTDEAKAEEAQTAELEPYDLPQAARRSPSFVGVLNSGNGGLGTDSWGNARGRYLSILMRRMKAPVASRWGSILLRRALLTQTPAPRGVAGADWVAERAWLLLRMGEADSARLLVQGVDVDRFTPKLFQVAMQSALANADPAAMCPLADSVPGNARAWMLARAMCAGLAGEPGTASALIDGARRGGGSGGIDVLLAEKVVGAGINGRRAVTIQWDGVNQMTAWRFGLANATDVALPDALFATVGPHVQAWQARAPMLSVDKRVGPASWAATLGVFSSAAYIDLYGALFDTTDSADVQGSTAGRLRQAYMGDANNRMTALRALWSEPTDPRERYARLVLTARAAARIVPNADYADDARNLIAAMLTAGFDTTAERWAEVANGARAGDDAWALLAVGASRRVVDLGAARVDGYAKAQDDEGQAKARFVIAALAGLGRISAADADELNRAHGVGLGVQNSWTRAIQQAARDNQPATVALIAATGMQTRDWRRVPPAFLYQIVSALRRVGHEAEARMIAAEAISRS